MSAGVLVPVVIAGGGIAWVLADKEPPPSPDATYGQYNGSGAYGNQGWQTTVGNQVLNGNTTVIGGNGALSNTKRAVLASLTQSVSVAPRYGTTGADPYLEQKFATIEDYMKAAYQNADDAAKKAGADAANKALHLDPPLKGDESWEEMSGVVGGAAGAALGAYLGGPIGAKLGAIAGAYLGVKLEDLISKNMDDLENWLEGEWGDAKRWAEGIADQGKDWAEDAYDTVSSWF